VKRAVPHGCSAAIATLPKMEMMPAKIPQNLIQTMMKDRNPIVLLHVTPMIRMTQAHQIVDATIVVMTAIVTSAETVTVIAEIVVIEVVTVTVIVEIVAIEAKEEEESARSSSLKMMSYSQSVAY
jgi:hypothetical protein